MFQGRVRGPHLVNGLSVVEQVSQGAQHGFLRKRDSHLVAHVPRVVQLVGALQHGLDGFVPGSRLCHERLPIRQLFLGSARGVAGGAASVYAVDEVVCKLVHQSMAKRAKCFRIVGFAQDGVQGEQVGTGLHDILSAKVLVAVPAIGRSAACVQGWKSS